MQHPYTSNCGVGAVHAAIGEAKRAAALYGPLNLIMTILFQQKKIFKYPRIVFKHYLKSTIRSICFLTAYVVAAWTLPCMMRNVFGRDERWMFYVNGLVAGSMVLLEQPGRRLELGM